MLTALCRYPVQASITTLSPFPTLHNIEPKQKLDWLKLRRRLRRAGRSWPSWRGGRAGTSWPSPPPTSPSASSPPWSSYSGKQHKHRGHLFHQNRQNIFLNSTLGRSWPTAFPLFSSMFRSEYGQRGRSCCLESVDGTRQAEAACWSL